MYLTFLLCFAFAKAKDCPDICGEAVEYTEGGVRYHNERHPDSKYDQRPVIKTASGQTVPKRIVNGYQVSDRGFITLIRAYHPQDEENYETCGGTLINDLYILTAGHCVCIQNSMSNVSASTQPWN